MLNSDLQISTCEMHTCGEPLRIVESGYPEPCGENISEKINWLRTNHDHLRRFLMHEPRGHYDMYGTLRVKPDLPNADVAFIFMHNDGYSSMCGHAIISLGRYCIDKGLVKATEPETRINIQCPCGLVPAFVSCKNSQTGSVRFHSVPSFVFAKDVKIEVPQVGYLTVDISYGGAFYAFVDADKLGLKLRPGHNAKVVVTGALVTEAVKQVIKVNHPENKDLSFLYGTIIVDTSQLESNNIVRQVTIFADSELDRSPCGSGTSAHVALLHSRGKLEFDCETNFQSGVNNTTFQAKAIAAAECGKYKGVTVEVSGHGYYTGKNVFTLETKDSLKGGFLVK